MVVMIGGGGDGWWRYDCGKAGEGGKVGPSCM